MHEVLALLCLCILSSHCGYGVSIFHVLRLESTHERNVHCLLLLWTWIPVVCTWVFLNVVMCIGCQCGSAQQSPHLHEYEKANQCVFFIFQIIVIGSAEQHGAPVGVIRLWTFIFWFDDWSYGFVELQAPLCWFMLWNHGSSSTVLMIGVKWENMGRM